MMGILDKEEFEYLFSEFKLLISKSESGSITSNERKRMDEIDEKLVQHNLRTTNNVILDSGMILSPMPLDESLDFITTETTKGDAL